MEWIARTERLSLRKVVEEDAESFLKILNDPGFVRFVGDRGVRTIAQARDYIRNRATASFEKYGFGPYVVERAEDQEFVGLCTLVKRDELEDVDIGFAFLPEHCGKGYAAESSQALLDFSRESLGLPKLVAIAKADNIRSISLLTRLGLKFVKSMQLNGNSDTVNLYEIEFERQEL